MDILNICWKKYDAEIKFHQNNSFFLLSHFFGSSSLLGFVFSKIVHLR